MEESFVKIVGISFLSFYCIKVLIISSIRAYKEIFYYISQSSIEISNRNIKRNTELFLDSLNEN